MREGWSCVVVYVCVVHLSLTTNGSERYGGMGGMDWNAYLMEGRVYDMDGPVSGPGAKGEI
jgi:hypothetical protein